MAVQKTLFLVALAALVIFTETAAPANESEVTEAELSPYAQVIIDALRPFKEEIRARWTRRAMTTKEEAQPMLPCNLCSAVLPVVRGWLLLGSPTVPEIRDMVISGCKLLGLAPRPEICEPIISAYTDQFLHIIKNTNAANDTLASAQICGVLTVNCTAGHPELDHTKWNITVAGNKPQVVDRQILSASGQPTAKIIQFTDIHMDLDYKEGTNTECGDGMPICCRDEYGPPAPDKVGAGPYGHFRCALPLDTLKIMFKHAWEQNPDTRYVFLTGDYIHSGVWKYNVEENRRHIKAVVAAMAESFPPNVTIFPLTGNHEPQVVNMYPPRAAWNEGTPEHSFDLKWLYGEIMAPFQLRNPTFLEPDQFDNFYKFGYYTASPEAGLRIIVLNTNLCSTENFWLGFSPYLEVREELKWLSEQLKLAEAAKEKVLIVGHIEPGSCWSEWSGEFNRVVTRYEGIIRGSFFGHSHKPQYRISMAKGTMHPVFSSIIAGSALPDSMNPTYSVFHLDGARGANSQWDVLRHELILLNLTQSNKVLSPVFTKQADSLETFGLPNLTPNSILQFAKDLRGNQELVNKFLAFHTKGEDSWDKRVCDVKNDGCMEDILCNIVSSNSADDEPCQQLRDYVREGHSDESAAGPMKTSWGTLALAGMLGGLLARGALI